MIGVDIWNLIYHLDLAITLQMVDIGNSHDM
jgi:hypothetical protein